jgi:hypothetical protein
MGNLSLIYTILNIGSRGRCRGMMFSIGFKIEYIIYSGQLNR